MYSNLLWISNIVFIAGSKQHEVLFDHETEHVTESIKACEQKGKRIASSVRFGNLKYKK